MRINKLLISMILVMSFIFVLACGQNYGKKLEFNGGELYYTSSVTSSEANKLGQFLVKENFFDGNQKSVQINKTGKTYEFRMVIGKGIENDPEYIKLFQAFASQLSSEVFGGGQVDIYLCDNNFETIRVIAAPSFGQKLEFNGGELYYTSSVTSSEANKLGQYLVKESFFDGTEKSVQINKSGSTYEFKMIIGKGIENDPEYIKLFKTFAKLLSTDVFGGSEVNILLCDEYLNTIRVVEP